MHSLCLKFDRPRDKKNDYYLLKNNNAREGRNSPNLRKLLGESVKRLSKFRTQGVSKGASGECACGRSLFTRNTNIYRYTLGTRASKKKRRKKKKEKECAPPFLSSFSFFFFEALVPRVILLM